MPTRKPVWPRSTSNWPGCSETPSPDIFETHRSPHVLCPEPLGAGPYRHPTAQPGLVPVLGPVAGAAGRVLERPRHAPAGSAGRLGQHGALRGRVLSAQFLAVAVVPARDAGHAANRAVGHGPGGAHGRAAG